MELAGRISGKFERLVWGRGGGEVLIGALVFFYTCTHGKYSFFLFGL